MILRPLLVGCRGAMGRRYGAILRHLRVDYLGIDAGDEIPARTPFDGVILATPTSTHAELVRFYLRFGVPILVEKPLATSVKDAWETVDLAEEDGVNLRMVNQYAELVSDDDEGPSVYDYFNHGRDGLAWDCISIVALANGPVRLSEDSPVWRCSINGRRLCLADMDGAYIRMIDGWLSGDTEGANYIRHAHRRVDTYLKALKP